MSHVRTGFDFLVAVCTQGPQIDNTNSVKSEKETVRARPEDLKGIDLIHAVYQEASDSIVGSSTAGFAVLDKSTNTLKIICPDTTKLRIVSVEQIMEREAPAAALALGGHFSVQGEQVTCTIEEVIQTGATYGEAALRAMLAYGQNKP